MYIYNRYIRIRKKIRIRNSKNYCNNRVDFCLEFTHKILFDYFFTIGLCGSVVEHCSFVSTIDNNQTTR